MKRLATILILVCGLAAVPFYLAGQSGAATEETLPDPEAEALWTYITSTNPYTDWPPFPGHEGIYPGESPHGAYLKLYVNKPALLAISAMEDEMPEGAILVKENYAEDKKTLVAVTPMYKVAGYNPEGGDWFWAKYDAEGETAAAGKVDGCINCHRTVEGDDWVFTKPR